MPQAIEFDKDHAIRLLACLAEGRPLEPPTTEGWRVVDQLMLAGAALFGVLSHGPTFVQPDLNEEQQVEAEGAFMDEIHGTIGFLAQVFMAVMDGEYDGQWEPVMRAVVSGFPTKVRPVEGWR